MKLELFFDYLCPYCYRGHSNIVELKEGYPELEIIWKPCEAHPRPEVSSVHSDIAIQGMYFIEEQGGDLWKYHELVYDAVFNKSLNIEDLNILTKCAQECGVDPSEFNQALVENRYEQKVLEGNRYAWGEKSLIAVPSYISGDKFIGSLNGILVSKDDLNKFLSEL